MKPFSLLNGSAHASSLRNVEAFGPCRPNAAAPPATSTLIILSRPLHPQSPPRQLEKVEKVLCGPPGQPRLKILRWTSVDVIRPALHAWEVPPATASKPVVAGSAASFERQSRSMQAFTESDPEASPRRGVGPTLAVASPNSRPGRNISNSLCL